MKKATTFFIAVMLPCALYAQNAFTQYLYWVRYQNQLIFNEKVYWNNDIDNRRFVDPDVQNQLIIHSRLHVRKGRWELAGGLTYSMAFAARPENGYTRATEELRPVLEISHEQPVGKIFIQNRFRNDFRFMQTNPEESVLEESQFIYRYRYRIQARIPLHTTEDKIITVSLRVADEIMFNHTENWFDQNRIYVTSEFYLNKNFSLEFGYLHIYQQRFGRDEYFNRHALRFSVLHRVYRK